MKVSQKHANRLWGGMNTMTIHANDCGHNTGWYVTVKFWIFSKRIYVCSDCGYNKEAID